MTDTELSVIAALAMIGLSSRPVHGVSIDAEGADRVASFVKQLGLTFPIGLDPNLEVANRHTVRALPSSFLIDRMGNTAAIAIGPRHWDVTAAHAVVEMLSR
jgi:hypothetical protein